MLFLRVALLYNNSSTLHLVSWAREQVVGMCIRPKNVFLSFKELLNAFPCRWIN